MEVKFYFTNRNEWGGYIYYNIMYMYTQVYLVLPDGTYGVDALYFTRWTVSGEHILYNGVHIMHTYRQHFTKRGIFCTLWVWYSIFLRDIVYEINTVYCTRHIIWGWCSVFYEIDTVYFISYSIWGLHSIFLHGIVYEVNAVYFTPYEIDTVYFTQYSIWGWHSIFTKSYIMWGWYSILYTL